RSHGDVRSILTAASASAANRPAPASGRAGAFWPASHAIRRLPQREGRCSWGCQNIPELRHPVFLRTLVKGITTVPTPTKRYENNRCLKVIHLEGRSRSRRGVREHNCASSSRLPFARSK